MRSLVLLLLASFIAFPAVSAAQGSDSAPDDTARRLGSSIETSTVRANGGVEYGKAVAIIDAPADRVFRVITDYAHYREFLPHFSQSRVLSRRGNSAMVYMQADVIHNTATLWAQMRIRERRQRGDTQIVEGSMIEGNMDQFAARWEVTPLADGRRTLLAFQILVDPDLPFPSVVFTNENVKAAHRTIRALRRQVQLSRYAVARNP